MKNKKEALGKGIRALLSDIENKPDISVDSALKNHPEAEKGIFEIPVDSIEVNPYQPRVHFDEEALEELAESIQIHGVVQPITVRRLNQNKFQLISGERRLRASKRAQLVRIPAYVREADDQEMLEIALIENIQRQDLNAIEIAINYKRLMEECNLTQEKMGARVGKKRATVTNYLRLLKLPPDIQAGIKTNSISMGHAKTLISIEDPVLQLSIYRQIIENGLSVRATEKLVRSYQSNKPAEDSSKKKLSSAYESVQRELTSRFSTKVAINQKSAGKGEIIISFFSDDDLNRILDEIN